MTKHALVIRLQAPRDRNGNGRRLYLLCDRDGAVIDIVDDEGDGRCLVDGKDIKAPRLSLPINIPPSEYRQLKKLAKDLYAWRATKAKEKSA